jgi:eukaryotic-like serine/threonine-protein kinase
MGSISGRVGTLLAGKYRIESVIAAGGMGTVYRARHRNQGEFAVKVLNDELAADPDMRARFLREGYAANAVRHRGVVAVVDDDVAEDGAVFMVMELLRGADAERLCARGEGPLELPFALAVADQLLSVLAAAHEKGIVHRDVKPSNLFVTTDGTVKVLDFGIARAVACGVPGDATRTGVLLGTPAFMAPEQARGAPAEIDATTDLWAVGATLFTLLTGANVHEAESVPGMILLTQTTPARSLATVSNEIPSEIVEVVDRALAFEKRARWESAAAMRRALRDAAMLAGVRPVSRATLAALVGRLCPASLSGDDEAHAQSTLEIAPTELAPPASEGTPAPTPPPHAATPRPQTNGVTPRAVLLVAMLVCVTITFGVALRRARPRR